MLVHHVDEVLAHAEHVPPRSEVALQSVLGIDGKSELSARGGHGLLRDGRERYLHVFGLLGRVITVQLHRSR